MNNLQIIESREVLGNEFRIYGNFNNPLFLAKDVASWIEHSDARKMLDNIDIDEKLIGTLFHSGQKREMWFLTEEGLYEVLMLSRKPIAKEFKKQVKLILKEIRQTGSYGGKVLPHDYLSALECLVTSEKENLVLTAKVEEQELIIGEQKTKLHQEELKNKFFDEFVDTSDVLSMSELAKILNVKFIGRNKILQILREHGFLDSSNVPYQKYINNGLFVVKEDVFNHHVHGPKVTVTTYATQKAILYIREKILVKHGYIVE